MNKNNQLLCTWSVIAFMGFFGIGFGLCSGFIPPTSPHMNAASVAAIYRDNNFAMRLGALITMFSCTFIVPFAAVISVQMKRIEGQFAVLAYTQFGCHILGTLLFLVPTMAWSTVAFRPARDPALMLLMNDFGWFSFMMPFMFIVLQCVVVGMAILSDRRDSPIFPRWLGFLNFWCALLLLPGGLVVFFETGPFAWNGLIPFWLGAFAYFGWYLCMFFCLRQAIKAQGIQGVKEHVLEKKDLITGGA